MSDKQFITCIQFEYTVIPEKAGLSKSTSIFKISSQEMLILFRIFRQMLLMLFFGWRNINAIYANDETVLKLCQEILRWSKMKIDNFHFMDSFESVFSGTGGIKNTHHSYACRLGK